jgi:ribosome-binding protein aMBF1 (putative translation factor)
MARKALSMKHKDIAAQVNVRAVDVMKYELGHMTEETTIEKLRLFFTGQDITVLKGDRGESFVAKYLR